MYHFGGGADCGRSYACVETGDTWEISVPSSQLGCEPKTVLKYKVYFSKILSIAVIFL